MVSIYVSIYLSIYLIIYFHNSNFHFYLCLSPMNFNIYLYLDLDDEYGLIKQTNRTDDDVISKSNRFDLSMHLCIYLSNTINESSRTAGALAEIHRLVKDEIDGDEMDRDELYGTFYLSIYLSIYLWIYLSSFC
jgi:hypothetical protein